MVEGSGKLIAVLIDLDELTAKSSREVKRTAGDMKTRTREYSGTTS